MSRATPAPLAAALLLACSGPQSMLEPAGPGAAAIEAVWWVLLAVCTAVFIAVAVALGLALRARRAARPGGPEAAQGPHAGQGADSARGADAERRRVVWVLVAGAAVPAVILAGIFVYTMVVLDRVGPSDAGGELTVVVTGKQFWWDVRYPIPGTADTVVTANEIHVPVGRRVRLVLESDNVIHSLWVPKLHGKTDLIPGRRTEAWLLADEPGVYQGQCAEYCGVQHTWMRVLVVAEPEEAFTAWLQHQRRPAAPVAPAPDPAAEAMDHAGPEVPDSVRRGALARNERIRRGRDVFLDPGNRCISCHTIRGETDAPDGPVGGPIGRHNAPGHPPGRTAEGPDLTHIASRRTLASGMLPLNRGNLGGWISNPQVLKPGNLMPAVPLEPADMNALLEYLMSLR